MEIVWEDSITIAKGYTFKAVVDTEGRVRFGIDPDEINPDDMEPMLSPDQLEALTATMSDDDRVMFGITSSLMTPDELQEWGLITIKANAEGKRIRGDDPRDDRPFKPLQEIRITDMAIAKTLVKIGLDTEALTEDTGKPIEQANELVATCVSAWLRDKVRPDNPDPDMAAMGKVVKDILIIAGADPRSLT
jgi:hypothetical protein